MTRVVVFAKAPIAGLAKTRLIPKLGPEGAAQLHARMVERTVRAAVAAALGPVQLACTPGIDHPFFDGLSRTFGVTLIDQGEGDLGARMERAIAAGLERQAGVIVVGTDCPSLDASYLAQAARALADGHRVVIGPAEDGGYVLIGARDQVPAIFTGIAWSTGAVLAETRAILDACGLSWCELSALWDVDRPEDFARLECEFPQLARADSGASGHNPQSSSPDTPERRGLLARGMR